MCSKQRNKIKSQKKNLNEMKISNLLNKKFQLMIINLLNKLGRRRDEHNEKFNKELENIKNQTELKNIITEIKNAPEGINNILDDAEKEINELEDRVVES